MKNIALPNIRIKAIEIYYPEHFVKVDDRIQQVKEEEGLDLEMDIKDFLQKDIVHCVKGTEENTFTMALEATKKVLASSGLEGKDLDMIVLASLTPEYVTPPTSKLLHIAVDGNDHAICYDMNANCAGMLFSLYQLSCQMQLDDTLNYVLLVGADVVSPHYASGQHITEITTGDSACAIILEKSDTDSGLIDKKFTNTKWHWYTSVGFPFCGFSKVYESTVEQRKCQLGELKPIDVDEVSNDILGLLKQNQLTADDISLYCFSQVSGFVIKTICKKISAPVERAVYIGDKYGYTGVTCTFFALYHAIKENKVKRGDYVLFWTYGSGLQLVYILIKY